jgi:hypothetical protein
MCEKFFPPREKVKSSKFEIDEAYREEGKYRGLSRHMHMLAFICQQDISNGFHFHQ